MEYHVPSVALAVSILKLLSRYKYKSSTLTTISEKLETNKTTCLRVLRTLQQQDFVRYNEASKQYSLGPYLIPLGNRASEMINYIAVAKEELKVVSAKTGLTSVLIQRLQDQRLIYIASEEPVAQEVRITVSVGQQFPIVGAAFGKCFLAYDDEESWRPLLKKRVLVQSSAPSSNYSEWVVDPEYFRDSLAEVRARGYAISHGELTPGFSAVAAPIFGHNREVVLVVACVSLTPQLEPVESQRSVIETLLATSKKLSSWIG